MNTQNPPSLWRQIQWPVIIVALLGGHMFIMLVAMTFALAGPPLDVPDDYDRETLRQPTTESLVPPSPKSTTSDPPSL